MTRSSMDLDNRATDSTITIGDTLLQHGQANDRVYIMKLSPSDFPAIIVKVDELALKNDYSKIIAKVPAPLKTGFEAAGYAQEAHVPYFFNGREDVYFMAKYRGCDRARLDNSGLIQDVLQNARSAKVTADPLSLPSRYSAKILSPADAEQLAALYSTVFESYPFPIWDPEFLMSAMADETVFFGTFDNGSLIAASSCEMNAAALYVEMTDFATHPEYRAQGLASYQLHKMEDEMTKRGIKTAYTIARAVSYGMNKTFSKSGYTFSGTLINNTNISGHLESMNVWYKSLS